MDIPKHVLSYDKWEGESVGDAIRRMKWTSEDMFKVVDKEGKEIIVNIANFMKCEILAYNIISNFDYKAERMTNYYYNRPIINQ